MLQVWGKRLKKLQKKCCLFIKSVYDNKAQREIINLHCWASLYFKPKHKKCIKEEDKDSGHFSGSWTLIRWLSVKGKNIQAPSRGYVSGKEIKMYNDLKLMLKTAQLCLDETSWTKMLGLFYSSWEGERIPAYLPVSFTSHSEAERQQL